MTDINSETSKTEELPIEERLSLISETIEQLQKSDTSLEAAFALYEQGMKQVAACNAQIDHIEKKIQILEQEEESQ